MAYLHKYLPHMRSILGCSQDVNKHNLRHRSHSETMCSAADVTGRPLHGPITVIRRGYVIIQQAWQWRRRSGLFLLLVQHHGRGGLLLLLLLLLMMMIMMLRPFLTCQQVSQYVRLYQGPFLDGRLLRLLTSWHAGGGDDDDDTVRSGAGQMMMRIMHRLAMGGTEGRAVRRRPFYLRRPHFSCRTKEPTLPTIEGRALKSSGATVPASSPAKPLSISKAFLLCWLTVHRRRALRASACLDKCCFWWGCRIMCPLRMLAAHSERMLIRSLSAPASSCLTTLGCALARYHAPGMGVDTATMSFPDCSRSRGGSGAVLTPLLWLVSGVPATDSCCAVPCCHGERVQANEALVMLDSPYALPAAANICLAGPSPAMTPLFSGLRGGSIGECLRKVLIGKQGCCASEISWVLTG